MNDREKKLLMAAIEFYIGEMMEGTEVGVCDLLNTMDFDDKAAVETIGNCILTTLSEVI